MSDKEKLLPCPFCGGKAFLKEEHEYADTPSNNDHHYFWVECKECGARTKAMHLKSVMYKSFGKEEFLKAIKEAIEAWNKRV